MHLSAEGGITDDVPELTPVGAEEGGEKKGMSIDMTMKKDENTGKRYAVYYIAPAKEAKS